MKNLFKKYLSLVTALTVILSVVIVALPVSAATAPTGYTQASEVVYKTSGSYIYNWGVRDEDCTFLSTYAQAFYTGGYVYSDMSQTKGGTGTSDAYSSALYSELKALMTSKHSTQTSYGGTRELYRYTDCEANGSTISSFYSGKSIGPNWDSGSTWNREHTWPNSKGLDGNDENDIMMLRPTATSENGSRGNTAYGKSSGYYNPNNASGGSHDLRGDVARITLYVYTRWGNTGKMWGTSGVMESLDVLLEWMEQDPVDTWEMGRNDAVQAITGTRNVYVDYPEYAWLLFGRAIPENYTSPSNGATVGGGGTGGGESGGESGGGTGGEVTPPTVLTVAEALAAEDGTIITVTGDVKLIDSQYPWNGSSMSCYIGDDAGNEIYLYRLGTEVKIGDNVTVTGTRYTYNSLDEIKDITSVVINSEGSGGGDGGESGGGEVTAPSITVAEALATADGTIITVTGDVKLIDSQYPWNGSSMSCYIGDDASNQIYLYKLGSEVKVGDNITVTGTRYTYNGLDEIKSITSCKINTVETGDVKPGDLNGDSAVTVDDALYILWYTYMPSSRPLNQACDYNKDGSVTVDDALYILWHTYMPSKYPLQ